MLNKIKWLNNCKKVETRIRCHIMWHLICVCTFCLYSLGGSRIKWVNAGNCVTRLPTASSGCTALQSDKALSELGRYAYWLAKLLIGSMYPSVSSERVFEL